MPYLGKDLEEIRKDLKELIKKILLNDLKDRRGRPVIEVQSIELFDLIIDEDVSNRNKIVFSTVKATCRVWVKNDEFGGSSNDNFQLRNVKPIQFFFDENLEKYEIENIDQVQFFNNSPF